MSRRPAIAVAVALATVGLLLGGCASSAHEPPATSTAPTSSLPPGATVSVWVATRDLARCTSVDDALGQGGLVEGAITAAQAPPGAVMSGSQLGGRWFVRSVAARAVVTTADVAIPPVNGC